MWFTNNIFISRIKNESIDSMLNVDEADNTIFRIEGDDKIVSFIYRIVNCYVFCNKRLPRVNASLE